MWVFRGGGTHNQPDVVTDIQFSIITLTPSTPTSAHHMSCESLFVVSTDDRHLHFEVGPAGSSGQPRFWAQFPSLWSGCRLSHGVLQGGVSFEVRLERKLLPTQPVEPEVVEPCGVRVGWSVANTSLLLGMSVVFLPVRIVELRHLKIFFFLLKCL